MSNNLIRYVRPVNNLSPLFSNILDSFFDRSYLNNLDNRRNLINEENDKYILEEELPRFKKDELKISFNNGFINISAQKKDKNNSYSYDNMVWVGENVDTDKISAKLEDGILRLELPKVESAKTKYIDVS